MHRLFWLVLFTALGGPLRADTVAPLVSAQWLLDSLGREQVRVLDLQSAQGYRRAHVPGAVNTDYGRWRTSGKGAASKMLPPIAQLESLIGGLGIDGDTHVVLVPLGRSAGDLATATRIYWTLMALGHDAVSILDGGLIGYARGGSNRPLQQGVNQPAARVFKARPRADWFLTKQQVREALAAGVSLVDNRSRAEYLGIYGGGGRERAGTVPGAVNLPYDWLTVNGGGQFHDPTDLKAIFNAEGVPLEGEQIAFCHTGHRASLAWFVSHELLGNGQARLYDGSMAEWASDPTTPVERRVELECKRC